MRTSSSATSSPQARAQHQTSLVHRTETNLRDSHLSAKMVAGFSALGYPSVSITQLIAHITDFGGGQNGEVVVVIVL